MEKYICVFCDERKTADTAAMSDGETGICRECMNKLKRTSYSLPYKGTRSISYIMSPFEYTGALRQVIIDFKFNNRWAYARLLAMMMQDYLDSYSVWEDFDCIIPVPLHKGRLEKRGYNQAELIAKYVSQYLDIPMRTDLLIRSRATKQQSTMKHIERVLNVKDAFKCTGDVRDKRILLLDDICTTGNTLQACAAALENDGAEKICALTLAIHTAQNMPIITY